MSTAAGYQPKGAPPMGGSFGIAVQDTDALVPITLEQRLDHMKALLKNPETEPQTLLDNLDRLINLLKLDGIDENHLPAIESLATDHVKILSGLGLSFIDEELRRRQLISARPTIQAGATHASTLTAN